MRFTAIILLLFAPVAMADYQSTVLADSPVGYWRLGEASGTTATDAGSGGNNGTYTPNSGGAWTAGTLGRTGALTGDSNTAVTPNGSTGYIDLSATGLVGTGSTFTIEGWFKTAATGQLTLYSEANDNTTGHFGFVLVDLNYTTDGRLRFSCRNDTSTARATAQFDGSYNDAAWHHFVAVKRASNSYELLVDGVSKATDTTSVTAPTLDRRAIGVLKRGVNANFFSGVLDEVAIYNTALTSTQVAAHYTAGTTSGSSIAPLLYYYDLLGVLWYKQMEGAQFNASRATHLCWQIECIPEGVTYRATSGIIPPSSGVTLATYIPKTWTSQPSPYMEGVRTFSMADDDDMARFRACMTSPRIRAPPECWWQDFDHDGDVDQADFGYIQSRYQATRPSD